MPEPPRLFLVTPPVAEAAQFAPLLETAVAAADIACLHIRTAAADAGAAEAIVRTLAPIAQRRGTAVLVDFVPRLVAQLRTFGALIDGVHVAGGDAGLVAALAAFRPDRIVGAGALADRDAAMRAGEAGVDYVMFGGPGDAEHARILDEAAWWAEIFNVPCVAYATRPDRVADLAASGAEFVALCDGLWDDAEAIAPTLRAAAFALASADGVMR